MAECKPAAASTTPTSSCERIISEFMAQGAPSNPANVVEGEILGGFQIKTPKVGDGFIEWAINGYDLEGRIQNPPPGVDYDKHGDWMFDKAAVVPDGSPHSADKVYDENYLVSKQSAAHDKTRKEG